MLSRIRTCASSSARMPPTIERSISTLTVAEAITRLGASGWAGAPSGSRLIPGTSVQCTSRNRPPLAAAGTRTPAPARTRPLSVTSAPSSRSITSSAPSSTGRAAAIGGAELDPLARAGGDRQRLLEAAVAGDLDDAGTAQAGQRPWRSSRAPPPGPACPGRPRRWPPARTPRRRCRPPRRSGTRPRGRPSRPAGHRRSGSAAAPAGRGPDRSARGRRPGTPSRFRVGQVAGGHGRRRQRAPGEAHDDAVRVEVGGPVPQLASGDRLGHVGALGDVR